MTSPLVFLRPVSFAGGGKVIACRQWEAELGHTSSERTEGESGLDACEHTRTVTTFIAGLARTVCESCGNVSIRYLGEAASKPTVRPMDPPMPPMRASGTPLCKRCGDEAFFITPWGLACTDHAWEAASRQDPLSGDFWIPLLIDRTDITG